MSTTVGNSSCVCMFGNYLLTLFVELTGNRRPGIERLDKRSSGPPEPRPPLGIAKERDDRVRKTGRLVGRHEMPARLQGEPFGPDRRRYDSFSHRQRFEDLQPRAAAGSERDDVYGSGAHRWPHV